MPMNAFLSLSSSILAFGDAVSSTNPVLRYVDWKRSQAAIPVDNPGSESMTLAPKTANLIFDSSRTLSLDNTTEFTLTTSALGGSRYRFTFTGGTDPVLRADRGLSLVGIELTLVANANGTMTMTAGAGSPFVSVAVADIVFVPGLSTGDAALGFSTLNEGEWVVLGRSDTVLTLIRDGDFVGIGEVVTPASDDILAYDPEGVQADDKMDLLGGFAVSAFGTYTVLAVTSKWFEVVSAAPLAPEVAMPGVSGMTFYMNAQRFVRIESDKDCIVRFNGDTGNSNRLSPLQPGGVGYCEKCGPVWTLSIVNNSVLPAMVTIITAE